MTETLELGPTPAEEPCEQLGPTYDPQKARKECRTYAEQLRRLFPDAVAKGVRFTITSNPHDFGTYYEVAAKFNEDSEEAANAAYELESKLPGEWDDIARKELGL